MASRVLGIDASLRSTGLGVIEPDGTQLRCVAFDVVKTRARAPLSQCLRNLEAALDTLIAQTRPEVAAIEGAFFFKNAKTAMILGQARGVVIAVCARHELPVYEYAPRRVKQAVCGFGGASKAQVQKMITTLLGLETAPPEDAADALAMAICHTQSSRGIAELDADPI